jgi:uncharacterized repeat protein (TIGR02543 family)
MKNLVFNLRTAKAQAEGCAKVSRMAKVLTTLTLLLTLGVGQAWGYTVYLYTGSFTDWESGADFQIWDGSSNHDMTSLGNHWYSTTLTGSPSAWIKRVKSSNHGEEWNSFSASITSSKNVWYVSGWNSGGELKYYIKHPWDGGSWTWQNMTFDSANTFKYTGIYKSGNGANVNQDKGDSNYLTPSNASNVNDKVPAIWTYTPSSNSLRIDPAYTLTVTNDGHGSASGSVSKGIKMSTKYAISASNNTGYHFNNWTRVSGGTCTFDNSSSASTNVTVTGNASATIRANFALDNYTITYNNMSGATNHASNPSTYTITSSDITLYAPTKVGYMFDGWYTNAELTTPVSTPAITAGSHENKVFYAKWTAITISEVSASPSSGSTGVQTMTVSFKTNVPRNSGYYYRIAEFGGVDAGTTGGGFHSNGNLISSGDASTLITSGSFSTINFASTGVYTSAIEIYTDGPITVQKRVTFTYGAGNYYTVSFDLQGHGSSISSQSILSGGKATAPSPAPTATGYTFGGWYKEPACTNAWNFSTETVTSDKILYAKWTANVYRITLNDNSGEGGDGYKDVTYAAVLPAVTNAPTRTGYTFDGYWDGAGGTGTQVFGSNRAPKASAGSYTDGSVNWIYADDVTLYAKWNEKMSTLTTSCHYDAGDPSYAVPTKSVSSIGISTTSNLVATAPGSGYTFVGWTLTHCVRTSGAANSRTITVRSDGSGEAASAVANYEEDRSSRWHLVGQNDTGYEIFPDGWNVSNTSMMQKASGHSTESVVYATVTISSKRTYLFKIVDDNGASADIWYGYSTGDTYLEWTETSTKNVYSGDGNGNNLKFTPSLLGTYEFKVDYSGTYPAVTITYPEVYAVSGSFNSWTESNNLVFDGNNGSYSVAIDGNSTNYEFKVLDNGSWYGHTNKTFTGTESNVALTTPSNNIKLKADVYPSGSYTFAYNKSTKKVGVTYPASYVVNYAVGATKGQSTAPWANFTGAIGDKDIASGTKIASGTSIHLYAANAKEHYTFYGWYTVENPARDDDSKRVSTSQHYSTSVTETKSYYAIYFEDPYWVNTYAEGLGSIDPAAGQNAYIVTPSGNFTATPNIGYKFDNWTQRSGALTITSPSAATTTVKATAASVLQANFSPRWSVLGTPNDPFGGWSAYNTNLFTGYTKVSTKDVGYKTVTLAANTTYEIKVYDRQTSTFYGGSANQDIDYAHSGSGNEYTIATTSSPKSVFIHSAAAGSYTLNWNLTDKKIAVVYPTSWFITSGQKTEGQDDNAGGSFTAVDNGSRDVTGGKFVADGASVTFEATPNTGYNFDGWYTDEDCTEGKNTSNPMTVSSITANKTIYAKFVPETYTVTLTQTGAASAGTASVTASYNADAPTIATLPTAAEGYAFMGYYSATDGEGTQFVQANGTWNDVTGYISGGKWIYDDDVELFAYFKKAEITDVVLNAGIFEPVAAGDPETYVTADPTLDPTPAPTIKLCWELRYSNDNPVTGHDPISVSGNQVKFLLNGLAAGGYKIHVELRTGSTCGAGTLLSSYDKSFSIASDHIVTIQYKSGDFTLKAPTSVGGKPLDWSEAITADAIDGYAFSSWTAGDGITITDDDGTTSKTSSTSATIKIKANYDGTLTANYTKKRMIYFNNTLGWESVYVYFYRNNKYWGYGSDEGKGTGSSTTWTKDATYPFIKSGAMTQIDGTDIWFYDCEANSVDANVENIVFTEYHQENYTYFSYKYGTTTKNNVICRGDYKTSLPMFVPLTGVDPVEMNNKQANYYNEGYWMNYPENTGYTLKIYNSKTYGTLDELQSIPFEFTADKTLPMSLTVELNANKEYGFEIHRADGTTYGNNSKVMKINDSGDNADAWAITSGKRTGVKTSVAGDYIFTLNFGNNGGYNYLVGVHYPVAEGDYRILYQDETTWSQSSAHTSSWSHPSRAIHKEDGAEDIVSFYVSKATGANATMKFQYASAVSVEGVVTWTNVPSGSIDLSGISASGVYNFYLTQSAGAISVDKIEAYTGKFYIRTDCAGSTKWENYRASDHEMPYTEFSMSDANSFGEKYSHYYTHWCPGGTNIKFVVANEYSSCISDTLESDLHNWGNLNDGGWLKHQDGKSETEDIYSANVRFMYNQETNKISRAYVSSSTNASRLFLVLRGNEVIKDENGTAVSDQGVTNGAILNDKENWIYERILQIKPDSRFKLFACYAQGTPTQAGAQYFRGAYDSNNFTTNDNSVILISGTGDHQKARILYDFKTNRLICAWLPSDATITEELDIDADVMVIRDHQEAAECITFSGSGELTDVKTVYGAMKFNRWTLNNRYRGKGGVEDNNKDHCDTPADIAEYHGILPAGEQKSVYERSLYFISFPFDVKVSEIFGFGTYGKHWILEYYDGLNRAKNGYWIDSPANWKYVTPSMAKTYELKAYEGYILCLSLGRMAYDNTEFWPNNISNVELYFPSKTPMTNIQTTDVTIPGLSDEYRCTINREGEDGDRRIKDSYWRCLGVPSYDMYAGTLTSDGSTVINWQTDYSTFPFLYAWNMNDNTLTPQSTNRFSFKPMHAYLTQIGTAIYWTNVSATPAVMARQTEEPTEYNWCLTLNAGEQMIDQTYVRMSTDEVITNEFDFGQDLSKELNTGRSDIYSFIGNERAAANSMQMNTETTTIVPLGLNIEATGEYTFSIPDGTNGIGITLIDEETGIRTSLSALDYTVELAAGDYTERFWLEISPVKGAETGIDPGVDARENGVRKVMIDGLLYIVRDGKMYDATGKRVE